MTEAVSASGILSVDISLFRRTLSLCFLHNGTKLPPDGGSLRTDVRKGLLHKDISTDKILTLEAKLPASGFCGHKKRKPQRFSKNKDAGDGT